MKHYIIAMAAALSFAGASALNQQPSSVESASGQDRINPFLIPYPDKYEIPPFESIQFSDYMPAVRRGIEEHKAEVEKIATNPATPTFENTILALEESGWVLDRDEEPVPNAVILIVGSAGSNQKPVYYTHMTLPTTSRV